MSGFGVLDSDQIEQAKRLYDKALVMQPGQQSDLMFEYCKEILIGGQKGSGKTYASIVWLIRGNLDVEDSKKDQTDFYYTNNPYFRAAVIRKNEKDLNDWIETAKKVYGADGELMGAKFRQSPREFTFPSGAKIILTHMHDKDSYMSLTGQNLIRVFWDEVTFEPSLDTYEKIFSTIRSSNKKMRPQMLVACNPVGPGLAWVKDRFVKYRDATGRRYAPGEVMKIPVFNPITRKTVFTERLFLEWKLDQNRELIDNDDTYVAGLAGMTNQSLVQAYLYGDWDAAGGVFFNFRRQPKAGEPPNACHIYDATKTVIQPWWPRLIGMDWGYSHYCAAFKVAMSPDGRVWFIDEMVHKGVGSREWGAMLARWCVKDMAGAMQCGVPMTIPIFLSPDAIEQRRDDYGTVAEMIQSGIREVLGPGASEILSPEDTGDNDFDYSMRIRTGAYMPLRRATNKRHMGWEHMRELMRWDVVAQPDAQQYSQDHARKLVEKLGAKAYFEYQDQFRAKEQAIPRLQISSEIRYLPDALESAVSSENDLEDLSFTRSGRQDTVQVHDDTLDAARYAAVATKLYRQIKVPLDVRVDAALQTLPENQRHGAIEHVRNRMKKDEIKGFRIGRGANSGVYIS